MSTFDRQADLLVGSGLPYFVRPVHVGDSRHDFEFGRVIRIEEYLTDRMARPDTKEEFVRRYFTMLSNLIIPAYLYGPGNGKTYDVVAIKQVFPVSADLFAAVSEVHFDLLRAPQEVIGQLQEVIDQAKSAI